MSTESPRDLGLALEVVARARSRIDALVAEIADRIYANLSFYDAGGVGPRDDFLLRLRSNVEAALDALIGASHDARAAEETGRMRARQGAPLADVLTAYRLGYTGVWAAVVAAGRQEPRIPDEVIITFGQMVFETHNRDCDQMIQAYRDEEQHLLLSRERERAALVDVVLAEESGLALQFDAVRALRLPMDGAFLVVKAACEMGQDPMPRIASALAAADVQSVWRSHHDHTVGLLSMAGRARADMVLETLRRHANGPVGVSPVFESLRKAAWALRMAGSALAPLGSTVRVEQFSDSALNLLLGGGPEVASDAVRAVLGTLLDLGSERSELLISTFEDWVDAGGSTERVSELLHCHPNTIRKRLRRFEEETGRRLGDPGDVAEAVAAVRVWRRMAPRPLEA